MTMKKCPACGTENSDTSKFCFKCGTPIAFAEAPAEVKLICPNCGREQKPGSKFCPFCGKPMQGAQAVKPVATDNVMPRKAPAIEPGGVLEAAPHVALTSAAPMAANANSVESGLNLDAKTEEAKKRMGQILGTDIDDQLKDRASVDVNRIVATNRDEVADAFDFFGLSFSFPRESGSANVEKSSTSVFTTNTDGTVHTMVDDDSDKRVVRRSTVVDSDGVYAKQFSSDWAISPSMIRSDIAGKSVRKEELERMRHSVEMGDISSNAAAAQIEANRNASVQ